MHWGYEGEQVSASYHLDVGDVPPDLDATSVGEMTFVHELTFGALLLRVTPRLRSSRDAMEQLGQVRLLHASAEEPIALQSLGALLARFDVPLEPLELEAIGRLARRHGLLDDEWTQLEGQIGNTEPPEGLPGVRMGWLFPS